MKQTLNLGLGQHLRMNPQMQFAIRLLQHSAIDLQREIREALESNLMLEEAEEADKTRPDWTPPMMGAAAPGPGPARDDEQDPAPVTLQDHLVWQLELTPFTAVDAIIARTIIAFIEDDGYLGADLDEIRVALPSGIDAGMDEIETVLHRIQRFDPVGVGARRPSECLDIQLGQLDDGTPGIALARRIVRDHLDDLAHGSHARLARNLDVDPDALEMAITLIQSLQPHPGAGFHSNPTEYVIPDIIVSKHAGKWVAELNPEVQPRLRINPEYARIARGGEQSARDHACLKDHLQHAEWLLKSLQQRASTLVSVAGFVVAYQSAFLEHGDAALRPLMLRDVASSLGLHESTISRVTANKWMLTPRGVIEFRRFFSGQLATADGDGASAVAVRALMRELLDKESPDRPLSDNLISERLAALGYHVARRTVAKYRDNMSIPPAAERRRVE